MKYIATLYFILILALFALSAFLAYKQVDGWGWFLVIAGIVVIGFSYKESASKTEDNENEDN